MTPGIPAPALALDALVGVAVLAWAVLRWAAHQRGRPWPVPRTCSFLLGAGLVVLAGPAGSALGGFAGHMVVHLLVGMLAPVALVLEAPVTLALRALPTARAVALVRVLRSRPVRALSVPWLARLLDVGGLWVLYCTPLYRAMTTSPAVGLLVQVHVLFAGCLFAWSVAGPDPVPDRPSVPQRLVVLGVAVAAHAVLAQLLHAGLLVDVPGPADERMAGAQLMYWFGDLAEVALALAVLSSWRPVGRPSTA
ncbi:cytochrome c oxidase assembly protein [Phycicoccus sp.]|uniref:cytochrome c oxidase assembly protein n=1 Tax=Phycicoccus sp. TaxID=1902410 RepID=UPI002C17C50A|nr:cytochrome c oxidase assembly protein [Phycicoccus sp.]HMM95484.1 cytochrome c oxidase assembly protein [Phycicoccus sp.]